MISPDSFIFDLIDILSLIALRREVLPAPEDPIIYKAYPGIA